MRNQTSALAQNSVAGNELELSRSKIERPATYIDAIRCLAVCPENFAEAALRASAAKHLPNVLLLRAFRRGVTIGMFEILEDAHTLSIRDHLKTPCDEMQLWELDAILAAEMHEPNRLKYGYAQNLFPLCGGIVAISIQCMITHFQFSLRYERWEDVGQDFIVKAGTKLFLPQTL